MKRRLLSEPTVKRGSLLVVGLVLISLATYAGVTLSQGQVVGPAPAPVVPREPTSFRDIVKKVVPSVVSVEALKKPRAAAAARQHLADNWIVPVDDENPNRVGYGSGFLVSEKGVVVTNNHVVEGADEVRIQTATGKKYVSTKVRRDPKTDLAIVLVDLKEPLPLLEFGDSETMEIGDRVLAIGAPFGLTGSVTHGIISGKGRSLKMNMYEDFLQTDAAINPGNSGGPLIDLDGKVIGINSAIKSRTGGFQGIGLAISSNLGKSIVESLLKDGAVKRGYLGVGIRDVDEEVAREHKLTTSTGVLVTRVYADAPGEKAGVKTGDVIAKIGEKAIRDGRELQSTVAVLPLGHPVDVELIRDGKSQMVKVTVEEQPRNFGTKRKAVVPTVGNGAIMVEKVGLGVADLTPELAKALEYSETLKGALITQMTRGGLGDKAGLEPGLVITSIDSRIVTTGEGAAKALETGSLRTGIALQVRGPRGPSRVVTLRTR